jgi:hypothetical protein
MSVDDFRSGMDAASSDVGHRPNPASERSAAVTPLRKIPPTHLDQRLSPERLRLRQIDSAFFGPFFRDKYGTEGDKALENGRIRYYGPVHPANDAGELAGRRYVHEFDTMSGGTRGWHETLDRMGNVRQIRIALRDGKLGHYQFDSNGRYKGSW